MKKLIAAALALILLCTVGLAQESVETEEKLLLTVTVEGIDYRLGISTAGDFAANGWPYAVEEDGTYSFYSAENESYFYVRTLNGDSDDPVMEIDLMWADGVQVVYCGFSADPDSPEARDDIPLWTWLVELFGAETDEEGLLTARVPLSDGSTLLIETRDVRVRLVLLPPAV